MLLEGRADMKHYSNRKSGWMERNSYIKRVDDRYCCLVILGILGIEENDLGICNKRVTQRKSCAKGVDDRYCYL